MHHLHHIDSRDLRQSFICRCGLFCPNTDERRGDVTATSSFHGSAFICSHSLPLSKHLLGARSWQGYIHGWYWLQPCLASCCHWTRDMAWYLSLYGLFLPRTTYHHAILQDDFFLFFCRASTVSHALDGEWSTRWYCKWKHDKHWMMTSGSWRVLVGFPFDSAASGCIRFPADPKNTATASVVKLTNTQILMDADAMIHADSCWFMLRSGNGPCI